MYGLNAHINISRYVAFHYFCILHRIRTNLKSTKVLIDHVSAHFYYECAFFGKKNLHNNSSGVRGDFCSETVSNLLNRCRSWLLTDLWYTCKGSENGRVELTRVYLILFIAIGKPGAPTITLCNKIWGRTSAPRRVSTGWRVWKWGSVKIMSLIRPPWVIYK